MSAGLGDPIVQGEDELGAAPLAVEADRTDLGVQQGMYPLRVCCFGGEGAWRHRRSRPDQMASASSAKAVVSRYREATSDLTITRSHYREGRSSAVEDAELVTHDW